jgi:hypothetical protein
VVNQRGEGVLELESGELVDTDVEQEAEHVDGKARVLDDWGDLLGAQERSRSLSSGCGETLAVGQENGVKGGSHRPLTENVGLSRD